MAHIKTDKTAFEAIRPYRDEEVNAVIQSLLGNHEFLDVIGQFRYPLATKIFAGPARVLLRPVISAFLRKRFGDIQSVEQLQAVVEDYATRMIKSSTDGFETRGLDQLDLSKPHLFVSNHRDITLDPAFTNYALHKHQASTVRIAIGDNLLSKRYASDLMRLNKSFIVRRSIKKPRELLKVLSNLSHYIQYSLFEDRHPVWIAQREGRAKDGVDSTDAAVIKMLFLAKPKSESFEQYLQQLRIVPVSIAYEYDPCLTLKTRELAERQAGRDYVKDTHEDLASIGQGISGYKGRVTISFGRQLIGLADTDELVAMLDKEIALNYRLYENNFYAYELLHGTDACREALSTLVSNGVSTIQQTALDQESYRQAFDAHLAQLPQAQKQIALASYANPIRSALAQISKTTDHSVEKFGQERYS